jgi:serine/threonine-protein kinase
MSLIDDLRQALGSSYTIERELGGGGMSRVFVGEEVALGRKVAVKVLAPELAAGVSAERFQREIKLAAQLQHPNIVPVLATGIAAGLPYYTMPFVDGLSLRERLNRNAGLPIVEALSISKDVARALAYAHGQGIVHRDIKPENVLLADEAAVVTDFGIAKALAAARTDAPGGTLTQAGTSLGTPAYMAPEQISADPHVDHRADIYSFGCVAYEMLTGAAPFAHRTPHQLYAAHITEKPAPIADKRPDCPPDVAVMIMKCLEKDPNDRPQSARDISRSLDASQSRPTQVPAKAKPMRRGRLVVASAIAGIAVFSAIAAYATKSRGGGDDIHSLAVLPFENIGGDTANAYFADGMSDELTTQLARVPGITLASSSAVARLKTSDAAQIGHALDVGGVIDGTVRRYGDRLKLSAQLTDVSSGKILWADSYEQQVVDVFAVEDSIAKSIVSALKLRLAGKQDAIAQLATTHGTTDPAAYDLYLRGKYLLGRRGNSLYDALKLFEEATQKDPKFARAYAGYAMAASLVTAYTKTPADSIEPLGLKAAKRALEIDPNLAEAHLGLANLLVGNFDWENAKAHYKRAMELEPTNATAYQWYADVFYNMGTPRDGLPYMKRATELDPSSPIIHTDYAYILLLTGDYEKARNELNKSTQLDSTVVFNESNVAEVLFHQGKYDSVALVDRGAGGSATAFVRLAALKKQGNSAHARTLSDSIAARLNAPHGDDDGTGRALLYSINGQPDSAFRYLNHMIDVKAGFIFTGGLPCYFAFQGLYSDPRWDLLLHRINAVRCKS